MMTKFARAAVLLCAATAAIAHTPAQADELSDVKARGALTCGVLSNLEPFGFQDSTTRELQGYDIDFCKGVAAILGVKPELKVVSLEGRIPELAGGRVDILAAVLGYTPERAKQITFSDGYFVSQHRLAVQADSPYKTRDDLAGKRISMIKSSSTQNFLVKVLPTANIVTYEDGPSAFMALAQRKVDAYALSETLLRRFIAKLGDGKMRVLTPPLGEETWGLGLRKNEPAFQKAVNAALQQMEKSGEAKRIFMKWLGPSTIFKMDREFTIQPIQN
ncbi:cysteine ABC transporter substrate-binding protein [Burkholderia cepacia]|nr:cysteine ABC transporter substrate-binding protein [Burkholderia cepacia]KWE18654.1 cysteine ABC transporter substrate-binding protein [Burkholderia cepacia]KWK50026.1 cysteine ABC transporter substrate-binding protein [Burkholderia stagnalis]KWK57808.1 cysteine ABC transporter substrate-binding protein [Burkholderia stagnalis]